VTAARIYAVTGPAGERVLVKAKSQAQALRHVTAKLFAVRVASALDVADYVAAGGALADATVEPAVAPEGAAP